MIELQTGLKKIDKVYHVSDIHLRNFKRHEEYKRVFKSIYDYVDSTKTGNSIIVLTGDIVHSKNDITPELVKEVTTLFKELSSRLPTIVIPGNHDANLNNNARLDSLTPIIDAMRNPNLFYLKDSGDYKIGNINFVHWGIFDKEDKYLKPADVNSECKIALYHAPVKAFNAEGGFDFMGNCLSFEDFAGFDLVMLGDLHSFHYVDEKQTAAYPGSLIQQNHGEGLEHGILVWDIPSKTAEFVKIKNDTCYYTVDIDNGVYEELPATLPKKLYLRLRYKNTDHSVIKQILANIREEREIIEVTQQKVAGFSGSYSKVDQKSLVDVRSLEHQNTLLSNYLKARHQLSDDEISIIFNINKELNQAVTKPDGVKNVYWSPKRFEFSNMFSYGEDNVVDFEKMTGTYGVFAPNASGKSSLLSALEYCIFDKCSKTSKAAQVMNNKASNFYCKLELELNGSVYAIERRAKKQKSESVKVDVDFYYYDEHGARISLNGKERSETNQSIRNVLGTYEDFVLTSMSIQGNNTGFIDMGQSDRKNLLSQFLDISIFEDLYEAANEKIKECSVLVREYKKNDYTSMLEDICNNTQHYSNVYRSLQNEKIELEQILEDLSQEVISLKSKLVEIDESITNVEGLNAQKERLIDKIALYEQEKVSISKSIEQSESHLKEVQEAISEMDVEDIEDGLNKLLFHVEIEKKLALEVEKVKANLINKTEKMEKLEELTYDENCKFCMDNVFVKDAIATKESIKETQELAKKMVQELREEKAIIAKLSTYTEHKSRLDRLNMELYRTQSAKSGHENNYNTKVRSIQESNSAISNLDDKITKYYEKEASIKNNEIIKEELSEITPEVSMLKLKLRGINEEIADCSSNLQLIEKSKVKIEDSQKTLERLEEEYRYYGYYITAVSKDGIPHSMMSTVIPVIEEDVNNILSQIVDFRINIKSDGKNINAYIMYEDDRTWPIELSSGMEKFISSLAIRTALINVCSLPRPNFLAIDEGFGVMDLNNMGSISVLMDYLKTQFKFILMISHIDSIKDVVDSQISVAKDKAGLSKVQYL